MTTEKDNAPDWPLWGKVPVLLLSEAVALSLNFNPTLLSTGGSSNIAYWRQWLPGFSDRLELTRRAVVAEQLTVTTRDGNDYVTAKRFAIWALGLGWEMPVELKELTGDRPATATPRSSIAAETKCQKWLVEVMREGPKTMTRVGYESEAIKRFGVSKRAFSRAWGSAVAAVGSTEWRAPGRKSYR